METKDKKELDELLEDARDFHKTIESLNDTEKEKVKYFALGLKAGSWANQLQAATA